MSNLNGTAHHFANLIRHYHQLRGSKNVLAGNLWEFNLTKVIIIDVSDDYRYMQEPMPSDFYPVLAEAWLPTYRLDEQLPVSELITGYLYDWHEI